MFSYGYRPRKAAQVVAFFALKQGGAINVLKLAKLLYLADRENLSRYDLPILFDNFVSMDHGPVTSITLNFVNGYQEDTANWDAFVSDRAGFFVGTASESLTVDDLDELSDAELGTLEAVWSQFGSMNPFQIRDWTHQHCQEWEDPHGSSAAIPYGRVLKFLGKEQTDEIVDHIDVVRSMDKALGYAR